MHSVYQDELLPEITVNCIVGKNGAGKSTLLDIIYRMINNLSVRMLGKKGMQSTGRHLTYAKGVKADLYFICEGTQYKLSCRDWQTTLYKSTNGNTFEIVSVRDADDPKPLLRNFFYTISTNYSLYAFNEEEYEPDGINQVIHNDIDGEWLKGLFHKNDGYFTPIVITPYRNKGNINVEKENRLASQRVMILAILSKVQQGDFFVNYEPTEIDYRLDLGYKERKEAEYQSEIQERYPGMDIRHVIRAFETMWEAYLEELYPSSNVSENSRDKYLTALFYLAYKTVKICFTYDDYGKALNVKSLVKASEELSDFKDYVTKSLPKYIKRVIDKILAEMNDGQGDRNHITLKLSVCMEYMFNLYAHVSYWGSQGKKTIRELISGKNITTYNDAVAALPPAFYICNMSFKAKNVEQVPMDSSWGGLWEAEEFSLNKMSSGERQILYSLSYVLYHIKNIQSVREDENRVAYHNICLIFDEVELYFHPDLQRRFLGMLLEALTWCHIDKEKIHSIQILMVTHSPFVLTDVFTQNTLYLAEGVRQEVKQQTFGANYYDMLQNSFFFENTAIGDVASKAISQWIEASNNNEEVASEKIELVGDELIRTYLNRNKRRSSHV